MSCRAVNSSQVRPWSIWPARPGLCAVPFAGERHEHECTSGYVPARAYGEGRDAAGARERRVGSALRVSCVVRGLMSQQVEAKQAGRRIGGGAIATLTGLAVLIIFVIQNREDVRFHFLTVNFVWPRWLYTIVIAVFGALVWFGLGVMRRHRRRKERRENRRY